MTDCIFLGSKITAGGDCSHEIKPWNCSHEIQKHLLPRRNTMTNVDSVLKSKDIPLPRKILIVKAMVFPVVMYGCERWTIKKAEHQRIEAFKPWCWRRLLKSPLDYKIKPVKPKGNQPWIFIGRTDAEAPILWPPDTKSQFFGKDSDAGGEGDNRGWDSWMASATQWTLIWANSGR